MWNTTDKSSAEETPPTAGQFSAAAPEFEGLRGALERLFSDPCFQHTYTGDANLELDVYEQGGKIIVEASLPGFRKNEIDLQLHDGVLSIRAEHGRHKSDVQYYRHERRCGPMARQLALPGVFADAPVAAELKDGVLTISIAAHQKGRSKQIEIESS